MAEPWLMEWTRVPVSQHQAGWQLQGLAEESEFGLLVT